MLLFVRNVDRRGDSEQIWRAAASFFTVYHCRKEQMARASSKMRKHSWIARDTSTPDFASFYPFFPLIWVFISTYWSAWIFPTWALKTIAGAKFSILTMIEVLSLLEIRLLSLELSNIWTSLPFATRKECGANCKQAEGTSAHISFRGKHTYPTIFILVVGWSHTSCLQ